MAVNVAYKGKVTLGETTVVGMGRWSIDGISSDVFEASSLGDVCKKYEIGMKDAGTVSFSGWFDPTDTTGQEVVQSAFVAERNISDIRFFWNSTQYWAPNHITGYFCPTYTTGAGTPIGTMRITSIDIKNDKSGICTISFVGRVSGAIAQFHYAWLVDYGGDWCIDYSSDELVGS